MKKLFSALKKDTTITFILLALYVPIGIFVFSKPPLDPAGFYGVLAAFGVGIAQVIHIALISSRERGNGGVL